MTPSDYYNTLSTDVYMKKMLLTKGVQSFSWIWHWKAFNQSTFNEWRSSIHVDVRLLLFARAACFVHRLRSFKHEPLPMVGCLFRLGVCLSRLSLFHELHLYLQFMDVYLINAAYVLPFYGFHPRTPHTYVTRGNCQINDVLPVFGSMPLRTMEQTWRHLLSFLLRLFS